MEVRLHDYAASTFALARYGGQVGETDFACRKQGFGTIRGVPLITVIRMV